MSIRSLGQLPRMVRSLLPALLVGILASMQLGQAAAHADPQPVAAQAASTRLTSATLEQCQTALTAGERSATFAGEMAVVPGAARMQMRIDVLERIPGEARFHAVTGLGVGLLAQLRGRREDLPLPAPGDQPHRPRASTAAPCTSGG